MIIPAFVFFVFLSLPCLDGFWISKKFKMRQTVGGETELRCERKESRVEGTWLERECNAVRTESVTQLIAC